MEFKRGDLSTEQLVSLYQNMLLPRMIEEKMLLMLRKGEVSKWFAGIGQEAIAVGATMAMQTDEYIMPLHRNLGVFTSRQIPLSRLFAQWMGKNEGFTKGRDRSFHFGTSEFHICGMISHLGAQLSVAAGVGLGYKLKGQKKCSLAFSGEGGTSEGEFHEALNTAAVWNLPTIFLIENNGYGLSTPTQQQYACEHLVDRAKGYGIEGYRIDGNNILEVYETVGRLANEIRENPRPILIECDTFRMRGHEEASGVKYVPKELFEQWAPKDPLSNYFNWLIAEGIWTEEQDLALRKANSVLINSELDKATAFDKVQVNVTRELSDVFQTSTAGEFPMAKETSPKRLIDACSDGLDEAMTHWDDLVIMGQDVAQYGGVFKMTEGFLEKYGAERIRNTPICESAIVGISLGLSLLNIKSIVEMQFSDFVSCGFNQIVNNLAKIHYRWNQNADVVIRMPTGAGVAAGPFHSQSTEAWFMHTPGLKVVYPSSPEEAKGLLLASIEDPNPVLFFEHKALYRSISGDVPNGMYTVPLGIAKRKLQGSDVSVITYGAGVLWTIEAQELLPDISIDLIDLRTLVPWDKELVADSVKGSGKVIVLHEDNETLGVGSEIASWIGENLFEFLDGPVKRLGSLDTPIPFDSELEKAYLPKSRLIGTIKELYEY